MTVQSDFNSSSSSLSYDGRNGARRSMAAWGVLACLCAVLIAGSVVLTGCGASYVSKATSAGAGSLVATPGAVSFGTVPVGTTVNTTVTLENQGTANVQISSMTMSGQSFSMGTQPGLPTTLQAGQALALTVQFKPSASGAASGQLTVSSDSTTGSTTMVSLSGMGASAGAQTQQVSALTCADAQLTGAGTDACTVTLAGAAATGGQSVTLTSNNAAVTVPASVTVAAGDTTANFTATATAVTTTQTATLGAGGQQSFALQLNPVANAAPSLSGLNCTNNSYAAAGSDSCSVTLAAPAQSGGFAVTLASNNASVVVPASVTVPSGATSAAFTATVAAVTSAQSATLMATAASVTKTFSIQLTVPAAPALSRVSCTTSSYTAAGSDSCSVTLVAPAQSGGFAVALTSNNASVAVPASLTVASGATSATFTATVAAVTSTQSAVVTATAGSVVKTVTLQLSVATPTLSVNATTLAFGDTALNTTATQTITLSSTGSAPVTINSVTITGTGFTLASTNVPSSLNPGQTAAVNVAYDPTADGSSTGQVTISSNSSTGASAAVSLTGTGVVVSVSVTWDAPTTSDPAVVSYNIYRATGSSSTYQQVATADSATSYTDASVVTNTTYAYYVTSVAADGSESVPSNTSTVSIP